jgi:hypothetical protein
VSVEQPDLFSVADEPEFCPCCQRPFLADVGKVGRRHPGTSRDAAKMPGKRSQAVRLLRLLASHGAMNAGQAASRLGKSPNQTATRMLELREAGLAARLLDADGNVVQAGTPMGGRGEVHTVIDAGFAYLSRLSSL